MMNSKPYIPSRLTRQLIIAFAVLGAGCAKDDPKPAPPPPPPCGIGVDQRICATDIDSHSAWMLRSEVKDPTQKPGEPPRIVRTVTMIQEFVQLENRDRVWRRTLTLEEPDKAPKTMMIQGFVRDLDKKKLVMTMDRSTCDGVSQGLVLEPLINRTGREIYYRRNGSQLTLKSRPLLGVQMQDAKDPLGQLVAAVVGVALETTIDVLVELVENIVTLGLLQDRLSEGNGSYTQVSRRDLQKLQFSYGLVGCFTKGENGQKNGEFKVNHQSIDSWWMN